MIPDTHVHLDLIEEDPSEVIQASLARGVAPVISVGISLESSETAARLALAFPGVYAAVGIHPNGSGGLDPDTIDRLGELARQNPKVVAIGETGLDYYRRGSPVDDQKRAFREHIRLARETGLPLVVHNRQAHRDVLDILASEDSGEQSVVLHCFSGDRAVLAECLSLGCYISFAGPITFSNAVAAREAAIMVPGERLLAETDSPFLSPEPFRGKPNRPFRVRLVAAELARLRSVPQEDMEALLSSNAKRVFGFGAPGVPT